MGRMSRSRAAIKWAVRGLLLLPSLRQISSGAAIDDSGNICGNLTEYVAIRPPEHSQLAFNIGLVIHTAAGITEMIMFIGTLLPSFSTICPGFPSDELKFPPCKTTFPPGLTTEAESIDCRVGGANGQLVMAQRFE